MNTCSPNDWMNLHENDNYKRAFRIPNPRGGSPIIVSFKKVNMPIHVLRRWLKDNNQEVFYKPLRCIGVISIGHLQNVDFEKLNQYMPQELAY